MSKNKSKVIARYGNFEVVLDYGTKHRYINIRAISGIWSISHRNDSPMYMMWLEFVKDKTADDCAKMRIVLEYYLTTVFYDEEFIRGCLKLIDEMEQRKLLDVKQSTEEEDEDALIEVRFNEAIENDE